MTNYYFTNWGFFDLCVGKQKETFGTVIIDLCKQLGVGQVKITIMKSMQNSRMGFYIHKGFFHPKDAIIRVLKQIWLTANLPCSKRLKAILILWLPKYSEHFGQLAEDIIKALSTISPSTIERILKPVRIQYQKRGKSTTKPGTLLRKQIPINTNQCDESRPGFLEVDTVAHCGDSLMGMFAYTIDFVDIATGWTKKRAVWGKGEKGVLEQIEDVEKMLPFPLLGFDSDNGGEFLNYHLFRHFTDRKQPIAFKGVGRLRLIPDQLLKILIRCM